jgi:hypothetical protein
MCALDDLRAWDEILGYLERAVDGIEGFLDSPELPERFLLYLRQYKATTEELARFRLGASLAFSTSVAVPTTIFAGVVCFLSGLLCFVKDAQPTSIRATSFAVVGGVLLLFVALVAHIHIPLWLTYLGYFLRSVETSFIYTHCFRSSILLRITKCVNCLINLILLVLRIM